MDLAQINEQMVSCGISPEAAGKLCESITTHIEQHKKTLDESYKQKVAAAKKICLEETEHQRADLAKKLQIFLEARGSAIASVLSKQHTKSNGDAFVMLEQVKNLLAGIPAGGDTALKQQVTKLEKQVKTLTESKLATEAKLTKHMQISTKLINRNRLLEGQVAIAKKAPVVTRKTGSLTEGSVPRKINVTRRQTTTPVTNRATINENLDLNDNPRDTRQSNVRSMPNGAKGGYTPDDVAEMIEE